MKFLYFAVLFALFSSVAYAQTILEVKNNSKNNDSVTITGKLTQQLDNDKFIIKDATGEIKIEIDDYIWQQINVMKPDFNATYTLTAMVDKEMMEEIELEATRIEIAK